MYDLMQTDAPMGVGPAHMGTGGTTRRMDTLRRRLYGPFVIVMVALALWALSRATAVAPQTIQPLIDALPNGLARNALIWLRDIAGPLHHYTSKLFVWIEPTAKAIAGWFSTTSAEAAQRFLEWVESL